LLLLNELQSAASLRLIDSERRKRQHINLSSAVRLFVLDYYRQQNGRGAVPLQTAPAIVF
jgi:predicted DNA-binding ribbon-helix-helix protein